MANQYVKVNSFRQKIVNKRFDPAYQDLQELLTDFRVLSLINNQVTQWYVILNECIYNNDESNFDSISYISENQVRYLIKDTDYTLDVDSAVITFAENLNPNELNNLTANYKGGGSIIWAEDITDLQKLLSTIDTNAVYTDGSNPMTNDFYMGSGTIENPYHNIKNVDTVDGIKLSRHNHTGIQTSGVDLGKDYGPQIPENGIENNAITENKLSSNSVTESKIKNNSVTENKLANNSVTENKIKDGSVTNSKIYTDAVTTEKIRNKNVTNSKIDSMERSKLTGRVYTDPTVWNPLIKEVSYDSSIAGAIGGYEKDSLVNYIDENDVTIKVKSLVDNNSNSPSDSNIKTPENSSSGKYWDTTSNKFTNIYCINKSAAKKYCAIRQDGNSYLHLDNTDGIAFDNTGHIAIDHNTKTAYLFFNNVWLPANTYINGQPPVRLPNYNAMYQLYGSSNSQTKTIQNDGWLHIRSLGTASYFGINGGLDIINDVWDYPNQIILLPIKAGDIISFRYMIICFCPYR